MRWLIVLSAAGLLAGQDQPKVQNGRPEDRTLRGDLASQLKTDAATWFGYEIRTGRKVRQSCDWGQETVHLDGTDRVAVLIRVEKNEVTELKFYPMDCTLDAGGLPFLWFKGVSEAESLRYMRDLLSGGSRHLSDSAIFVISQHSGQEALNLLIEEAKSDKVPHLRGQALFWLSQRAGEKSAAAIQDAIVNDPDTEVKKKAVFALSQLPHDEGVPKLIQVAKTQRNREVRKQAFFWLGQTQDARALAYIEDVLTH